MNGNHEHVMRIFFHFSQYNNFRNDFDVTYYVFTLNRNVHYVRFLDEINNLDNKIMYSDASFLIKV